MGKFIAQDWDLRRPLWEMVLVENYHDENGSECAVITRGSVCVSCGSIRVLNNRVLGTTRWPMAKVSPRCALIYVILN